MSDIFWLNNPTILFKKNKITQIWPYEKMSIYQKLNATTRFIILITLIGFMILNNYIILLFGSILILLIIFVYFYLKRKQTENFEDLKNEHLKEMGCSDKNPLCNVMLNDYTKNVNKKEVTKYYDETKENVINNNTKDFIYSNNKSNKDIGKIFNNLDDQIDFETSMRQFYINPSTTIPNNQKDFLKFCYNDLYSEKPLLIY